MLLHPPTLLPSRSVSYLQILTWLGPRCYLLKLTFRSGWSQCTWQGGEEPRLQGREQLLEAEREAAARSGGFWGGERATTALQQFTAAELGLLPGLSQPPRALCCPQVPSCGPAKASPTSAPSPPGCSHAGLSPCSCLGEGTPM